MVKIMHIADVHLDRKTEGLTSEKSLLRRAEYKETFEKAIDTAKKENVKIILICGDLFDSCQTEEQTIEFVRRVFAKVPEIHIFISPGNHDPLSAGIYKKLCENLSENVKIFGSTAECVYLDSINTRVYGMGFASEYQKDCLLQNFRVQNDDTVNLICIHGDLKSQSEYNPVSPSDIADTGADYVALGHTHTFLGIQKSGKTHYAYSGALEPGGFDETGEKGVIMGDVGKSGVDLKFVPLQKRMYNVLEIDISDCEIFEDIAEKVRKSLANPNGFYKIVLTGEKKAEIKIDRNTLSSLFSDDVFYIKVKDNSKKLSDLDAICGEYTLKGACARRIAELSKDGNKEFYDKAAEYLFSLF